MTTKRKRTGAVARLPKAIRDRINGMLDEGHIYKEVLEYLSKIGFEHITLKHLYHWRYSGYQDWVESQERVDERIALQDWAQSMAGSPDKMLVSRALTNFSAAKLHKLLSRIDVNLLAGELGNRPEYVARLFNALLRTSKMSRDGAIALDQLDERDSDDRPGLSEETRRILERELKIM